MVYQMRANIWIWDIWDLGSVFTSRSRNQRSKKLRICAQKWSYLHQRWFLQEKVLGLIRYVLLKEVPYPARSWLRPGNGIINTDGDMWKVQRRAGLHFLSSSNLKYLTESALPKYLVEIIKRLESSSDRAIIDIEDVFHELTTQIMGRMAYDVSSLVEFIFRPYWYRTRWTCTILTLSPRHLTLPLVKLERGSKIRCGKSPSCSRDLHSETRSKKLDYLGLQSLRTQLHLGKVEGKMTPIAKRQMLSQEAWSILYWILLMTISWLRMPH